MKIILINLNLLLIYESIIKKNDGIFINNFVTKISYIIETVDKKIEYNTKLNNSMISNKINDILEKYNYNLKIFLII